MIDEKCFYIVFFLKTQVLLRCIATLKKYLNWIIGPYNVLTLYAILFTQGRKVSILRKIVWNLL